MHACLEEWWLARYWHTSVDKDLRVSDPALLVPVEPLGFFGRRVLDEPLCPHSSIPVHAYHYMTPRRVCSNFQQHLLKPRLKATGATDSQDYGNKYRLGYWKGSAIAGR